MARTAEANQRLRDTQRAKILASASKVFARLGKATTIADVAAEAGISQGLAYRYFVSKEALFQALIEQALQADPIRFHSFLDMPGTPGKRLELLVSHLLENRREHPDFYQLLDYVQRAETTSPTLKESIRKRGQSFFAVMMRLIAEGQASGEIRAGNPFQFVLAIAACLEGLTKFALLNDAEHMQHSWPDAELLLRMIKL